jgi:hypothetical protein
MTQQIISAVKADISAEPPDWCATKWVLEPVPFLFIKMGADNLWRWKAGLAARLEVDPKNILVTGSAAVGVSLNPYKSFKSFDKSSDVDIAVISTYHFDVAWRTLRNLGTRLFDLTASQKNSVHDHMQRYIYWGTIATDRLLPMMPFGNEWIRSLSEFAAVDPVSGREINARIYRDFASLRAYLHLTFRNLRDNVLAPATETSPLGEPDVIS